MKISEAWLREWVDPKATTAELAHALTMAGLEIESMDPVAGEFANVVVAQIMTIAPHPKADRLQVCQVKTDIDNLTIVCGGKNIVEGMKVPLAMIGAQLPGGLTIKLAPVREVMSHGMLCSATELGLAMEADGIVNLPQDAPLGMDIRDYLQLNDRALEVNITPNRGDCLSVAGVARDVAAIYSIPLKAPVIKDVAEKTAEKIPVVLEGNAACKHYVGRVIKNINAKATTPLWMQERLRRSGFRSISPVVDVTNYVMIELGQPMHAFDLKHIEGGITARLAKSHESVVLLDNAEVVIPGETTVIADNKKVLAIAGVMGGLHSGISETTKDLFLESAFFEPVSIARTSKKLNLKSDSSYRFERGVDPLLPEQAMKRAMELLLDIVGGEAGPIISIKKELPANKPVLLRHARLEKLLGLKIEAVRVEAILKSLAMEVTAAPEGWLARAPSYRFDISIEEDLIEEIGRIYGYDHLHITSPTSLLSFEKPEARQTLRDRLNLLLSDHGYHEIISYSFVDEKLQGQLGFDEHRIPLMNPISAEMNVMRTTLLPGLLTTALHNVNRQQLRLRLFEQGICFTKVKDGFQEEPCIAGLLLGSRFSEQWSEPQKNVDFYDAKGDCDRVLAMLGNVADFSYEASALQALHPGQGADIFYKGDRIGFVGAVHPHIVKTMGFVGAVFVFHVNLAAFSGERGFAYQRVSKFPAIRRDLAFVVRDDVVGDAMLACIRKAAGESLVDVLLFDVYQGKGVLEGHKSVAFGLTLQDATRTLVEQDIALVVERVVLAVKQAFGAELRE